MSFQTHKTFVHLQKPQLDIFDEFRELSFEWTIPLSTRVLPSQYILYHMMSCLLID